MAATSSREQLGVLGGSCGGALSCELHRGPGWLTGGGVVTRRGVVGGEDSEARRVESVSRVRADCWRAEVWSSGEPGEEEVELAGGAKVGLVVWLSYTMAVKGRVRRLRRARRRASYIFLLRRQRDGSATKRPSDQAPKRESHSSDNPQSAIPQSAGGRPLPCLPL